MIERALQAIDLTADLAVSGDGGAYQPRGILHSIRSAFKSLGSSGGEAWFVPTGAVKLMETLHAKRRTIDSSPPDFDSLPNVCIEGVNAPLVASQREGGQTVDHDTYLLPTQQEGSVDVFFPTCFDALGGIDFMAIESKRTPIERASVFHRHHEKVHDRLRRSRRDDDRKRVQPVVTGFHEYEILVERSRPPTTRDH